MLTSAWTKLRPHPAQSRLWRTKKRFALVAAGRGSGKTELARRRVVRFLSVKKPWPDPLYFYALPTLAQAKRVAWGPLLSLIPKDWIKGQPNKSEMKIETVFGSTLYVLGMDKPMRAEGVQWDGGVIDESCDQRPGMFDRSLLPAFSHRRPWCWRIGVPKRFGIGSVEFRKIFERGLTGNDPDLESFTWPSEDILSDEELRYARDNMDARDYREQYKASWESTGGGVFWAFDEVLNVQEVQYVHDRPLVVGSDFNVNPMSWVIGQQVVASDGVPEVIILDELFIRNTNTQRTLDYLYEKYKSHTGGWEFYGDATGKARHASASASDYAQIRNDERFKNARIFYPSSNPLQVDRYAACNAMFKNAAGRVRCRIHPRCKRLIQDMLDLQWKVDSAGDSLREADKYGDLGHMSDAFGYYIHRRFPVMARSSDQGGEIEIRKAS